MTTLAETQKQTPSRRQLLMGKIGRKMWDQRWLYIFALPGLVFFLLFSYYPMIGIIMAFQDYNPVKGYSGSDFVGMDNFQTIFHLPDFTNALRNTLIISGLKLVIGFPATILFALLINEIHQTVFKRFVQTISYLPYFISWVIAAGLWYKLLSPDGGLINEMLTKIGFMNEPFYFMGSTNAFLPIVIFTELWKNIGFNAIIYLAALSSIDPHLYEVSSIDGASRVRQIWHIALPGIRGTMVLLFILSASGLMSAGFDQLWTMGNLQVQEVGQILDTLILSYLRNSGGFMGLSLGATMGVFQATVGLLLFLLCNFIAKLFKQESLI
ncbi:sugar ABC transporter permease [Paenibacillus sp. BC26]|uniref:ABC transporter permease n=1 Tax=Paenibacillus sp. BC26 TaxID=1881032 RepID=UPI0008E9D92D|nr:ABC transporter permease subunit [Paenibacillus sp. BC26]SFT27961.1 putative aldouronate transport system permease protein [Paenibacillus sp. BC26]